MLIPYCLNAFLLCFISISEYLLSKVITAPKECDSSINFFNKKAYLFPYQIYGPFPKEEFSTPSISRKISLFKSISFKTEDHQYQCLIDYLLERNQVFRNQIYRQSNHDIHRLFLTKYDSTWTTRILQVIEHLLP